MKSCPWQQIELYLMQLEVASARYNIIYRHLFPLTNFCCLYSSVATAVGILRVNWNLVPHVPPAYGYAVMGIICIGCMSVGYNYYRVGEMLVSESNETLSAFRLRAVAAMVKDQDRLGPNFRRTMKTLSRRMFRRRPLVIRLWFFMRVADGMALAFLQSVLENILTGILMMNMNVPMHLV